MVHNENRKEAAEVATKVMKSNYVIGREGRKKLSFLPITAGLFTLRL